MPSDEDIAKLRGLLLKGSSPGSMAASDRLDQLEDWEAVERSWNAALDKVVSDPEGAITAARTTLESVCKHICDERGVAYDDGGDLAKLYKAAAASMDIAPDRYTEQTIKQILSGVATVVNGLAAMRNSLSDSHGRGKTSVRPAPRHAKLAVNAGFAVAGFLIDTHVEKPLRTT
ncbi:abortive infection family protein [Nocardia thailandica]|uniref:Abortive infection family protein n=1 Tax=Nocardia thailandica TaxID=257275 RepID=A0ABW6PI67_9NOCA